jgi:SAM-dependent methyltransferase
VRREDERLLLGSSFGAAAVAYAEHRPDYAQDAVRWALERAPGARVLDLGAGTGKLTATLLALGAEVIAVEPDPAMLTELHRAMTTVRALPGSAEAIPLPDASVDAVLAGNAMHWFDMDAAGPEILAQVDAAVFYALAHDGVNQPVAGKREDAFPGSGDGGAVRGFDACAGGVPGQRAVVDQVTRGGPSARSHWWHEPTRPSRNPAMFVGKREQALPLSSGELQA